MWQSKCSFLIILAFFLPFTISTNSTELEKESELETANSANHSIQNNARQARIMHLVKERRPPIMKYKSRPVPYTHTKILSRNDHHPMRHIPLGMSPINKRHPIMRRVQAAGPYPFEPAKNTRYQTHKTSKPSIHREYAAHAHAHPNALTQTFKPSPLFSGQAIVRPVYELLAEAQKPQTDLLPVQQFPLPQETPQRPTYLNQQEQFIAAPPLPQQYHAPSIYYEKKQHKAPQPQQQYAVYEEPENNAEHVTTVKFANAADAKEALEFIQFMGSDAYFLPKQEPDYRQLDAERDRKKFHQQLQEYNLQQQEQAHEYSYQHATEKTPRVIYSDPTLTRNSHVVQGSYQTGKNIFVVNSDGNKAVKHIVSSTPHTLPNVLESTRYTPPLRRRTQEPLRFEFTEQDAIVKAYTNDPSKLRNYVSSTARPLTTHKIPSSRVTNNGNSGYHHRNTQDDPVDDDDIQNLHSDYLGRVPLSSTPTLTGISSTPPSEQKDTEDYCERICANVQDNDEEIICGSDGYMYTSEAQMECYASCLHLDVTITGKGACTAR